MASPRTDCREVIGTPGFVAPIGLTMAGCVTSRQCDWLPAAPSRRGAIPSARAPVAEQIAMICRPRPPKAPTSISGGWRPTVIAFALPEVNKATGPQRRGLSSAMPASPIRVAPTCRANSRWPSRCQATTRDSANPGHRLVVFTDPGGRCAAATCMWAAAGADPHKEDTSAATAESARLYVGRRGNSRSRQAVRRPAARPRDRERAASPDEIL